MTHEVKYSRRVNELRVRNIMKFVAHLGYFCTSKELGEGAAAASQSQHRDRTGWKQGRHRNQESYRPPGVETITANGFLIFTAFFLFLM